MLTIYLGTALMLYATIYWSSAARARPALIFIGNIVFLAWLGWLSLALYAALFAVVFFAARLSNRRSVLIVTVTAVLAPLLFFKLGRALFGLETPMPLGLSYFTLMLLGFHLDLRRRTIETPNTGSQIRNSISFSSFAPIVAMGPIERAGHLAPQIARPASWNSGRAGEAIFLVSLGLFKKFVIADRLSDFVVDSPRHALQFDGAELWVLMFTSFVQIYCDFSGFVDIARGFSKLLGLEVIDNFDQPYLAKSIPEIWRRWHISLVEWLRDFVYNPIALKTRNLYLATAAVMFAVGFWHDITWRSFGWASYWTVLYGGSVFLRQRGVKPKLPAVAKIALTILAISFSTFFFLPRTLNELARLTWNLLSASHLFAGQLFKGVELSSKDALTAGIACAFVIAFETWHRRFNRADRSETLRLVIFVSVAALIMMATVAVGVGDSKAFFYLRF